MPCLPAHSWELSSPRSLRLLAPAALARFLSSTSKAGRRCTIFRSKRADISFDLVRERPSRRPLSPRRCRLLLEIFEMPWVEEVSKRHGMTMTQTDFLFVVGLRMIRSYF